MNPFRLLLKLWGKAYPPRHLRFYLQRCVRNPALREMVARWAVQRLPRPDAEPSDEQKQAADILRSDGYVMLDNLVSKDAIAEVKSYLEHCQLYDRWNPAAGNFQLKDRPPNCHTAPYSLGDLLQCPHVLGWANDSRVLRIVEQVLRAKPTLSNLSIWWSFSGHTQPQEAEFYHRDVDDLRFIKLFIYLSDVDDGAGPHKFIRASHRTNKLMTIRRFRDAEVESAYPEREVAFTGPAGSVFLENTFGLHKGQLARTRDRLLFQAQYSLHPIGVYDYRPMRLTGGENADIDPYINRLYVQSQS